MTSSWFLIPYWIMMHGQPHIKITHLIWQRGQKSRIQAVLYTNIMKIYKRFFTKQIPYSHPNTNEYNYNIAHLCGCADVAQGDQLDGTVCHKVDKWSALFLHCVVSHGYIVLRLCGTVSHRGGNSNYGLLNESPGGSYSITPFTVIVQTE